MTGGSVDPLGKHWKFNLGGQTYCAGLISEGEPNERIIEVHGAVFNGQQATCAITSEGTIVGPATTGGQLWQVIKEAAESAFNYEFAEVALVVKQWSTGDTVPDWDTYELIP